MYPLLFVSSCSFVACLHASLLGRMVDKACHPFTVYIYLYDAKRLTSNVVLLVLSIYICALGTRNALYCSWCVHYYYSSSSYYFPSNEVARTNNLSRLYSSHRMAACIMYTYEWMICCLPPAFSLCDPLFPWMVHWERRISNSFPPHGDKALPSKGLWVEDKPYVHGRYVKKGWVAEQVGVFQKLREI